jgi:hypothetical protein
MPPGLGGVVDTHPPVMLTSGAFAISIDGGIFHRIENASGAFSVTST